MWRGETGGEWRGRGAWRAVVDGGPGGKREEKFSARRDESFSLQSGNDLVGGARKSDLADAVGSLNSERKRAGRCTLGLLVTCRHNRVRSVFGQHVIENHRHLAAWISHCFQRVQFF